MVLVYLLFLFLMFLIARLNPTYLLLLVSYIFYKNKFHKNFSYISRIFIENKIQPNCSENCNPWIFPSSDFDPSNHPMLQDKMTLTLITLNNVAAIQHCNHLLISVKLNPYIGIMHIPSQSVYPSYTLWLLEQTPVNPIISGLFLLVRSRGRGRFCPL